MLRRVVFWNVKKRKLTDLVCELAKATIADSIILLECSASTSEILNALRSKVDQDYFAPQIIKAGRFLCFCRIPELDLSEIHRGLRTSIRRFSLGSKHTLLGFVHGCDIRNYDDSNRQSCAQSLMEDIRFIQTEQRNDQVILIGDFNLNPYDRAMNAANGWNAMMTRNCVSDRKRKFLGKKYNLYYNPMWSLMGDGSEGPPGTIYDTSRQGPYGWSMLDQVLFSHTAVDVFKSVRVLAKAGPHSLVDARGRPDSKNASDHLPILVEIIEN